MPCRQATLFLPCHSLEDFPTHHTGKAADSLLANWTASWHPSLIAHAGQIPRWTQPEELPDEVEGQLFLVPTVAEDGLPFGAKRQVESNGGRMLTGYSDRTKLITEMLAEFDVPDSATEFAPDFFGLSYVYLQVQLMTRQLRGTSNLDDKLFEESLVQAAKASLAAEEGDRQTEVSRHLQVCFDLLIEEKNNYYPVPCSFVDLVLVAESTLGKSLHQQLAALQQPENSGTSFTVPQNWLITGELIEELQQNQSFWGSFKTAVQENRLCLAGGLDVELPFRLLDPEALTRNLHRYRLRLQELGLEQNDERTVFAQRSPGLTGSYPGILESCGLLGALHTRFEPIPFPRSGSGNIRWEGEQAGGLIAFAQEPKNANRGETFLRLGLDIGEQIDSAHLSTILLAHWPGQLHFAFEDLVAAQKFGSLFGRFVRLDDYFEEVYDPGYGDTYSTSEYAFNALKRDVKQGINDPVSRFPQLHRWSQQRLQLSAALTHRVGGAKSVSPIQRELREQLDELQRQFDRWTVAPDTSDSERETLESSLNEIKKRVLEELGLQVHPDAESDKLVLLNFENPKRITELDGPTRAVEADTGRIVISNCGQEDGRAIVEVPAYGRAEIRFVDESKEPDSPKLVDGRFLRNEYFEVEIDEERGGIRSLNQYQRRNNLLSQRLSFRQAGETDAYGQPVSPAQYADMICDGIRVVQDTPVVGELEAFGRLLSGDRELAKFKQYLRLTRGSRLLEIRVELKPLVSLAQTHGCYFCSRLAWKHESEDLIAGAHGLRSFSPGQWLESPTFFEIVDADHQITFLTGGLPFHRRSSARTLDTILIPFGESAKSFRFGIGVNVPLAELAAREFVSSPLLGFSSKNNPANCQPLVHLNSRNILVTYWDWIADPNGKVVGIRLRIRETLGRSGQVRIATRRGLAFAARTDFTGQHLYELETESNTALLNYEAFDYAELHLNWNE